MAARPRTRAATSAASTVPAPTRYDPPQRCGKGCGSTRNARGELSGTSSSGSRHRPARRRRPRSPLAMIPAGRRSAAAATGTGNERIHGGSGGEGPTAWRRGSWHDASGGTATRHSPNAAACGCTLDGDVGLLHRECVAKRDERVVADEPHARAVVAVALRPGAGALRDLAPDREAGQPVGDISAYGNLPISASAARERVVREVAGPSRASRPAKPGTDGGRVRITARRPAGRGCCARAAGCHISPVMKVMKSTRRPDSTHAHLLRVPGIASSTRLALVHAADDLRPSPRITSGRRC